MRLGTASTSDSPALDGSTRSSAAGREVRDRSSWRRRSLLPRLWPPPRTPHHVRRQCESSTQQHRSRCPRPEGRCHCPHQRGLACRTSSRVLENRSATTRASQREWESVRRTVDTGFMQHSRTLAQATVLHSDRMQVSFHLGFQRRDLALAAGEALRANGFEVSVEQHAGQSLGETVTASPPFALSGDEIAVTRSRMEALARDFGGEFLGHSGSQQYSSAP